MKFDTIIIGGGLGGLTSGALLGKFGKKSLLLEQHYIPGGCATVFKRKDYLMEVGLHEMDGLHDLDSKPEMFDLLGISNHVEFKQVPELFRIKSEKFDVVVPHGRAEFVRHLSEQYPEDAKALDQMLDLMEGVLKEVPKLPTGGWKGKLMLPLYPLLFPNVVKASKYTVGEYFDKHFKSEELKIILQGNLVYFHDDPYTLDMTYFSVAQASYIGGGGHFIKGGSQQLSNHLANRIEQAGGQVLLGKKVTKILVESGKAVGVEYQDAYNKNIPPQQVYAEVIIANAAIPLVKQMLPESEAKKLGKKIDQLEPACSLISLYIGFNKDLKSLGVQHYSTFLMPDTIESIRDIEPSLKGKDWKKKPFVFVDYSQIDAGLTPKGKTFGVICTADYLSNWENLSPVEYKKEKRRVAKILLDRLEEEMPGIVEHIEHYEVGTAKTVQNYIKTPGGTAYGFAQTQSQAGNKRLPLKSPTKNLYFASAWAMPGGGFTGAFISGFLCGLEVGDRLNGKTNSVQCIKDHRIVPLIERKTVAENTFELVFEKPKDFTYQAGQYAILTLNQPKFTALDVPHRPLSMVSHPDEPTLRFAMRGSESSFKKSCLAMQVGDIATIYGPMGDFSIQPTGRPVVFLIAGIGITPVPPFFKQLEKENFAKEIHLFYTNFTEAQTTYHQYFEQIDLSNFSYHPIFSDIDGLMNRTTLEVLGDLKKYDFYVVGTSGFLRAMEEILAQSGVAESQVYVDDFG